MAQPSQEGQEQEVTQGWGGLVQVWADPGSTQEGSRGVVACVSLKGGATEGQGLPQGPHTGNITGDKAQLPMPGTMEAWERTL